MKRKKTVITAEKHEVWVIRQGLQEPVVEDEEVVVNGEPRSLPAQDNNPDCPPTQDEENEQ